MSTENTTTEVSTPTDVISEILSEFQAAEPAKTEAPPATQEATKTDQQLPDVPVTEEAPKEREAQLSPLLAEKARKEREYREKLANLESSQEQAIEDAKAAVVKEMMANPQAFVTKYGVDAGDLAMQFYAAELGDDAPAELKQQLNISDSDRKLRELEQKFEQRFEQQHQAALQAQQQTVIDQYNGFLTDVPSELPYFAAEVEHSSTEALRAMADLADHLYVTSGKYPSAPEVARLIETQIADTVARYTAVNQTRNVEQKPVAVQKPIDTTTNTTTLSNELSGGSSRPSPSGEDELFDSTLDWMKENFTL